MFQRQLQSLLNKESQNFRVLGLVGPRQSGKTTLLRHMFPNYRYVSLESPDLQLQVREDPRGFFMDTQQNWILDEVQNVPQLFSYIQEMVDDPVRANRFILSGSQNFLMLEKVSQTLAGRIALYELFPLTYQEFQTYKALPSHDLWTYLYNGQYARPYHESLPVKRWFDSYIQTYLERDVRSIENIRDISQFHRFLKLCAGRHGQQLNLQGLANDVGVSITTIQNWISILEASYIIFRLPPYYNNYRKRLTKTPKMYFYDSGIVAQLLGIQSPEELSLHSMRGSIFEGFIISEIKKTFNNLGIRKDLYYWRTQSGEEIDLMYDDQNAKHIIEIKSSATFQSSFVEGLLKWQTMVDENVIGSVFYAGNDTLTFKNMRIHPWNTVFQAIQR